jgi:ferric-dicitrate binding protein FerR (iron transport regulator)
MTVTKPLPDRDDEMRTLLRQMPPERHIDPARAARVRRAAHEAWVETHARRPVRWPWWLGAGLAAAAGLAGVSVLLDRSPLQPGDPGAVPARVSVATIHFTTGAVWTRRPGSDGEQALRAGDALTTGGSIVTGPDGRGTVALRDGVQLRLDRETQLGLESEHRVRLGRGAIYVDTTSRQGVPVPLEIAASGAVARDIGTRFEVRLLDRRVRIRVRDGVVEVTRGSDSARAGTGGQLLVSPATMLATTVPIYGPDWTWIVAAAAPRPVDGRSLTEFLSWVEREDGRTIRIDDAQVARDATRTTVYGSIDGLTVEEALEVVLPTCGLAYRLDGDTIRVFRADASTGGGS